MARPEPSRVAIVLCLALAECTVFNDKSVPVDGGAEGSAGLSTPGSGSCACPAGVLCADFENGIASPWSAFGGGAEVDGARAHCGKSSLHLHADHVPAGGELVTGISETQTFGDARFAKGFFARAWFFLPLSSKLGTGSFTELFKAQQEGAEFLGIATQLHETSLTISNWAADPAATAQTSSAMGRDSWVCLEWQVAVDASGGSSRLWIGGAEAPAAEMTNVNTRPSPPLAKFFVDVFFSQTEQPAFDIWVDDVAVDVQRIRCGP